MEINVAALSAFFEAATAYLQTTPQQLKLIDLKVFNSSVEGQPVEGVNYQEYIGVKAKFLDTLGGINIAYAEIWSKYESHRQSLHYLRISANAGVLNDYVCQLIAESSPICSWANTLDDEEDFTAEFYDKLDIPDNDR